MRPIAILLALLLGATALAGCLGAQDGEVAAAAAEDDGRVTIDESRPDPVFADVVTGPSAAPDAEATLAAPPQLKVGEWWRIRLDHPRSGESSEFVRVLAAIEGDTYLFGMPHEGWWKEAVIFHTPAFGEVNAHDLSYNTHDILFQPLKFPLEDGQTWETEFSGGRPMTATVEVLDATRAKVTFTSTGGGLLPRVGDGTPNVVLELVYDAAMHEVVEFNHGTVTFTVIDHGYDFEGWVTIPRGERLVFFHGRIGPGLDIGLQPAPPVETVEVAGGYNRMSFITVAQSLGPTVGATCSEKATAPDGTVYETSLTPCQGLLMDFHESTSPDGVWSLEHVVGGTGVAFIEGIAYHQYDIHLPSGAIRSDHSHEVIR